MVKMQAEAHCLRMRSRDGKLIESRRVYDALVGFLGLLFGEVQFYGEDYRRHCPREFDFVANGFVLFGRKVEAFVLFSDGT